MTAVSPPGARAADALEVRGPAGASNFLPAQAPVTIGRHSAADVRVDDDRVSRRHATLRHEPGGWVLEDAGSRNGLFRGGERVSSVTVAGAVVVNLGAADGPAVELRCGVPAAAPPGAGPPTGPPSGSPNGPPTAPPVLSAPAATLVRIGRSIDNDTVVDDLLASRHHAELRWDDEGWTITDLDSHNGTFVNGKRIRRPVRLADLDVIGVGGSLFRLVAGRLEPYVETGAVAFEVQGVTVRTETGDVLVSNMSFRLEERSLLAIVGPSGCGKSTLLNAITGFRPADEGVVRYRGRDLYDNYEELRLSIGFVPQDDIVHGELTVSRALAYAADLRFPADVSREERRRRVDEVIGELGLSARRDLPIKRLSGGQRKRTSVGLELLTRPSLLFLDEPTSGLDPGYERGLMQQLRDLADSGRTVVVVTHTVQSLRLCDRVLVLAGGGRLAYFGPPQLAPAYFGCDDYTEIFQILDANRDVDWPARFYASAQETSLGRGIPSVTTAAPVVRTLAPPTAVRQGSAFRQYMTLVRRYLDVIRGDRRNVMMLVLQAPLIGALMLFVLPRREFALPKLGELRLLSRAAVVIFQIVICATWLGLSNAIREIVKERAILRRERAVGLSAWAYVASKATVLAAFTVVQTTVLVLLATFGQGGPEDATVLGWPLGEMIVVVALAGLAAMGLGLLCSALVKSPDMALTLLPILLVLENVLAMGGTFPEVVEKPVLQQMTYVASSQYAYSAAASTVDLNRLQAINNVIRKLSTVDLSDPTQPLPRAALTDTGEPRYDHVAAVWWANVLALVGLTAASLIVTGLVLERRNRRLRA